MTRVPTTASYNLYISRIASQKQTINDYSYQSTTGYKYDSYDKYGLSTYRLQSLQNEQTTTTKYLETNNITQVYLESQQTALDGIRKSLTDFRSQLREFYSNDLTAMSKDPTEEEKLSLQNMQEAAFEAMSMIAYYLNTQVDGNYIFGGGNTTTKPVNFPYTTLEEFQAVYNGDVLTYPSSLAASLSEMTSSADVTGGLTISQEYQTIDPKYSVTLGSAGNQMTFDSTVYPVAKAVSPLLDTVSATAANPMTFTAGTNVVSATAGTFNGYAAGDTIVIESSTDNNGTYTIGAVAADGSSVTLNQPLTTETSAAAKVTGGKWTFDAATKSLTAKAGTFLTFNIGDTVSVDASASNSNQLTVTGISADGSKLTFAEDITDEVMTADKLKTATINRGEIYNSLKANAGTFNGYATGDRVVIEGTGANDQILTVKSVSEDGSEITFLEKVSDETLADSTGITLTRGCWEFSSVTDVTTGITTNSLKGRVGSFSDLRIGEKMKVEGSVSNTGYLTVKEISQDGSTIIFEEKVNDETIRLNELKDASIRQSTQVGTMKAGSTPNHVTQALTVAPVFTTAVADAVNQMTFAAGTNTVTAAARTFSDFTVGSAVIVTGSAGNDSTLTVKSVSADGSQIEFNETLTAETSATAALKTAQSWNFSAGEHSLTAAAGTFADVTEGDKILIDGSANNAGYLTVKSVSEDGSKVVFEEAINNESLNTTALETTKMTDKKVENTSLGTVIETYTCGQPLMTNTAENSIAGNYAEFINLKAGQTVSVTDNSGMVYELYVKDVSEDGSKLYISSSTPVPSENLMDVPLTLNTHSDISGFITDSMKCGEQQTGDVGFSVNQNCMTATVKGAYSGYKSGDAVIIKGADGNDKMYKIESVSQDGRTIYFSKDTPVTEEMSLLNGKTIPNGKGITICKTYSEGATIAMNGAGGGYNGKYTVIGVSNDGKTMQVKTEDFPEYDLEETLSNANIGTETYYDGGQISTTYRLSATSAISGDVNAASSAFEKIFRALGTVAQDNMLDAENPENATKRVSEALDLLDDSLTADSTEKNGDITSIQYSVISKLDTVKTTIKNQTTLESSLEGYIASLTQVDKTEAATLLLNASNNLEMSYKVLATINNLTLLNFL